MDDPSNQQEQPQQTNQPLEQQLPQVSPPVQDVTTPPSIDPYAPKQNPLDNVPNPLVDQLPPQLDTESMGSPEPTAPVFPEALPSQPELTPAKPKKSNLKLVLGLVGGFIFGFIIVALAIKSFGIKDAKSFTVSDLKDTTEGIYSFKYNKKWVKSSDSSVKVAYGDNKDFNKANSGFAFAPEQSLGNSWGDYDDTQKATFVKTYTDYVEKNLPTSLGCKKVGELTADDQYQIEGIDKAIKITVSCNELNSGYAVKDAKMNLLLLIKGSNAHIAVAISGPISSYEKSSAAFEAIFKSIRINE